LAQTEPAANALARKGCLGLSRLPRLAGAETMMRRSECAFYSESRPWHTGTIPKCREQISLT
jgi:hypothetical protein